VRQGSPEDFDERSVSNLSNELLFQQAAQKRTLLRSIEAALERIRQAISDCVSTKAAKVRILYNSRLVKVQILDRGQGIPGFTSLKYPNVKLGVSILGMRERIRQLKGQLEVESGAGGTIVTAVLPIDCVNEDPVLAPKKCA
jgi:signal transduction histidine kinase